MLLNSLESLFDYNYWANRRLLEFAGSLPAPVLVAPAGVSHGSLLDILIHILFAEWIWRVRTQEGFSPGFQSPWQALDIPPPAVDAIVTFEAIKARWSEEERALRAYLASLRDSDLTKTIRYQTMSGSSQENTLWQLLIHLVNHGTQHRSEAAYLLSQSGHSPGDLDFILYLRREDSG